MSGKAATDRLTEKYNSREKEKEKNPIKERGFSGANASSVSCLTKAKPRLAAANITFTIKNNETKHILRLFLKSHLISRMFSSLHMISCSSPMVQRGLRVSYRGCLDQQDRPRCSLFLPDDKNTIAHVNAPTSTSLAVLTRG